MEKYLEMKQKNMPIEDTIMDDILYRMNKRQWDIGIT